jgi:hypothetical protein
MAGARVLHWNGRDLPDELRELPAGTSLGASRLSSATSPSKAGPEQTLMSGETITK